MLIIGLACSVFGIGFFCWLLFTLAVYALPFFAGVNVFLAAFHSGAGVNRSIVVGVLAGGLTLTLGQVAFATVRSPLIRGAIGLLYAVPAAIAGYNGTLGFAQMGIPSEAWRVAFAVIGAIAIGGTAWARIALFVPPEEERRIEGGPDTHRLAGAARQG
jgi:hypothetical protein